MRFRKVLRIAIVVQWCAWGLCIMGALALSPTLPPELQEIEARQDELGRTQFQLAVSMIAFVSLVVHALCSVALFLFKRWAKRPYIFSLALAWLCSTFVGSPIVITTGHWSTSLGFRLDSSAFGFICALILITDVLDSDSTHRRRRRRRHNSGDRNSSISAEEPSR